MAPWESVSFLLLGAPPWLQALTLWNMVLGGACRFRIQLAPPWIFLLIHCKMEAEGLMAFILDPHDNMGCPQLASLSFGNITIPGDILVKVVQSCTSLPGCSALSRPMWVFLWTWFFFKNAPDFFLWLKESTLSCLTLCFEPALVSAYLDSILDCSSSDE